MKQCDYVRGLGEEMTVASLSLVARQLLIVFVEKRQALVQRVRSSRAVQKRNNGGGKMWWCFMDEIKKSRGLSVYELKRHFKLLSLAS